jgi:hypothetical protein
LFGFFWDRFFSTPSASVDSPSENRSSICPSLHVRSSEECGPLFDVSVLRGVCMIVDLSQASLSPGSVDGIGPVGSRFSDRGVQFVDTLLHLCQHLTHLFGRAVTQSVYALSRPQAKPAPGQGLHSQHVNSGCFFHSILRCKEHARTRSRRLSKTSNIVFTKPCQHDPQEQGIQALPVRSRFLSPRYDGLRLHVPRHHWR